ncbi:MAG: hypothetical protein ABEK17_03985 [Candidatus Aenigmatarchaeota archaeon]
MKSNIFLGNGNPVSRALNLHIPSFCDVGGKLELDLDEEGLEKLTSLFNEKFFSRIPRKVAYGNLRNIDYSIKVIPSSVAIVGSISTNPPICSSESSLVDNTDYLPDEEYVSFPDPGFNDAMKRNKDEYVDKIKSLISNSDDISIYKDKLGFDYSTSFSERPGELKYRLRRMGEFMSEALFITQKYNEICDKERTCSDYPIFTV